ncbi:hypothetical protein [Streptomyces lincolnensis]|uniref:hypothetical protein n=1 Tax=Streptomyces lincolnensis TaxID=1915 RepID=UPI0037CF9107
MKRLRRITSRLFRRTPAATGRRAVAPLWVRGLTAGGRPIVLGVALLMCAPGEYHLAENAGWNDPFTYGMPVVLSAYAGIAAAVASTRRPGDRGRWSAIVGACLALGLAMAAQVVSHLISTGHVTANQPLLIAVTSLVPPAVVGHLLHLAATPPDANRVDIDMVAGSQQDPATMVQTTTVAAVPKPVAVTVQRVTAAPAIRVPADALGAFTPKAYKELLPAVAEPGAEPESRPEPGPSAIDLLARQHRIRPEQIRTVAELLDVTPNLSGKAAGEAIERGDRYGRRVLTAARELRGVRS